MCLIVVLFQVNPRYPLVIAANREERRDRPSTPPYRWEGQPTIWAGRDEVAGGTWLGVNSLGLVAALTNRRDGDFDASLPSRGSLCLDALRQPSPADALAQLRQRQAAQRLNPFNLLCANRDEGWVVGGRGYSSRSLQPGTHILSNRGNLDDGRLARVRRARSLLAEIDLAQSSLEPLFRDLAHLCADTEGNVPLCQGGGNRGTVSSSLIALDSSGAVAGYWHAQGPPSQVPYQPVQLR